MMFLILCFFLKEEKVQQKKELATPEVHSTGVDSPEVHSTEVHSPEVDATEVDSPEVHSTEVHNTKVVNSEEGWQICLFLKYY